MQLTPAHISLDRPPGDKIAAIAQAAAILVETGCVEDPFRYGMIAREAMGNTYLGHGIALPHGVEQTERYIRQDGIAFIRTASAGIPWGPQAEKVDTIIAIAAASDNYLHLLRHITTLMEQPDTLLRLKESSDPAEIIALLTQESGHVGADILPIAEADEPAPAHQQGLVYPHAPGLHLHPASILSTLAKNLDANVRLVNGEGKSANASNIPELLALGITHGQAIVITADSREAVEAVIEHISQESQTPEEALLPPEVRQQRSKMPWLVIGALVLALLIYILSQ